MVAFGEYAMDGTASAMKARDYKDATDLVTIQNATRGKSQNGLGVSESGPMFTLDQASQHAVAFPANLSGTQCVKTENLSPSLGAKNPTAVAVDTYNQSVNPHVSVSISSAASDINHTGGVIDGTARVRRLTPVECERLQGFPDGYTDIPWKGKPAPDGPRYKALGNSMAVPCMAWIGRRIARV
jgi:DNA (cytosine-5)-methyltransferase 1